MNVLFVASEAYPFIKTGGLGEVMEALPKALAQNGDSIRVVIPKYRNIDKELLDKVEFIGDYYVQVGWRSQYCGVYAYRYREVTYYLLDNEYYFNRDLLYGYYDDGEKFSYFSKAIFGLIEMLQWKPDIIHCNDWQTGMVPVIYKKEYIDREFFKDIKIVFSIHNLFFKGEFGPEVLPELFGYNYDLYNNGLLRFKDGVSFLKGGIEFSNKVITVSKEYAKEIKTSEYGEGLEEFIKLHEGKLVGIVNGIDYDEYNPDKDKNIYENYTISNINKKYINKEKLQESLNLVSNKNTPVISMVSRLATQKGFDLIIDIMEELLKLDIQLVILGTGEKRYEEYFKDINKRYPSKVYVNTKFDNNLAHKIYAGSDIFLMPSLFEPCGLSQLISLRYGTVPIVRETGGLKDTVLPYNKYNKKGNGFGFKNYKSNELLNSIVCAIEYYHNKDIWMSIILQGMNQDNSWDRSAIEYRNIYKELIENKGW